MRLSSNRMKVSMLGYLTYHVAMYTKYCKIRIRTHIEKSTFLNKKIITNSHIVTAMLI